jgi:hypothetical protein
MGFGLAWRGRSGGLGRGRVDGRARAELRRAGADGGADGPVDGERGSSRRRASGARRARERRRAQGGREREVLGFYRERRGGERDTREEEMTVNDH